MPLWLNILLLVLLLALVVAVIMENGHPSRTLAWVLILVLLPPVGLLFFYFFGISRRRRRLASGEDLAKIKARVREAAGEALCAEPPAAHRPLVTLLERTGHALPLKGNDVRIYTDFNPMFEDLLADLEQARHHIHFQFFIFAKDKTAHRVAEVLARKAAEGVEVRVLVDGVVNFNRRAFYRRTMEKQGVQLRVFRQGGIRDLIDANYRNHRKNVVIDGRIGYTGGVNIANRYAQGLDKGGEHRVWRDTHMRVAGPVVAEMQAAFLLDWRFSARELLDDAKYFPPLAPAGDLLMQMAISEPMGPYRSILHGMEQMIAASQRYVYIQTPYFIPGDALFAAMRNAALSGVDVRLMIPPKADLAILNIIQRAGQSYFADLMDAGVKIYFYQKGFLHPKMVVADDEVATVGSTNLDVRSLEQDCEINAFFYDADFAVRMREGFLQEEGDCTLITPEDWARRSGFRRFLESLTRLLSPVL